jgi:hypothetical protein
MVYEVELERITRQHTTVFVEAGSIEEARAAGECEGWYFAGDVPPEDWEDGKFYESDTTVGNVVEAPNEEASYWWADGEQVSEEEYREYLAELAAEEATDE